MVACREGQQEVATILYHWSSAAASNQMGQTLAAADQTGKPVRARPPDEFAGLQKAKQTTSHHQRRLDYKDAGVGVGRARTETTLGGPSSGGSEFRKPGCVSGPSAVATTTRVARAPSLEGYLGVPTGSASRRSPSPLQSPGYRSASDLVHRTKIRLKKRPSVDSGINVDANTCRHKKELKQLSK